MNNKQQLQQEIAELQKQLEEKQKVLAAMPDKWRPKAGKFYVDEDGTVSEITSHFISNQDFGNQYTTREQAEKAAKAMRAHNRLLAYVAEFAPDYEPKFSGAGRYENCIVYSHSNECYEIYQSLRNHVIGAVYMPYEVATELKNKLNSGEVEL